MKAIILAGGEGRRLRPLTDKLPKPMLPIMNRPLMSHTLHLLKQHNITEIAVTIGYRGDVLSDYFKDGENYGVQITYFQETEPLGTAGAVKNATTFLNDDFIVISGDILTDIDLTSAISYHKEKNADITVITKENEMSVNYGVVVTDESGKVQHFYDCPDWDEVCSDLVSTGIYIMKPSVLNLIPEGHHYDVAHDLFPALLAKKIPIFSYEATGYWTDLSDVSAYRQCHIDIFNGKINVGISPEILSDGVLIDKNCEIGENVRLEPYTVIGENVKIGAGSTVKDSILWSGTVVPENTELLRTITCGGEKIETSLEYSTPLPCHQKNCFSGKLNEDITPEFINQLCLAFADCFGKGAKILLSLTDDSRYLMPKFAFLSGLIAGGAEVYNLVDAGDRSVAKFALRKLSLNAGIHVQITNDRVRIELLNQDGTPLERKTITKLNKKLLHGDFTYISPKYFRSPINVRDMSMYYFKDLITQTPNKRLKFSIGICAEATPLKHHFRKIASAFGMTVLFTNDEGYLPQLITGNRLDFGILIGENGKCALYDENGKVLSGDLFYELITLTVLSAVEGGCVLMPQHATDSVSQIAETLGGTVCRVADYELEAMLLKQNNASSRLQHDLCFDPIRGIVRICEFLFLNSCTLSQVSNLLPKMYKIAQKIDCPASKKARVMKRIIALLSKDKSIDLTDGLKISDERGWILIMPDIRYNHLRILTESFDEEYAVDLAGDICSVVEKLMNE